MIKRTISEYFNDHEDHKSYSYIKKIKVFGVTFYHYTFNSKDFSKDKEHKIGFVNDRNN